MHNQWTIGKQLITAFLTVAALAMVLGLVGYYGLVKSESAIDEIGVVRLPSVASTLEMEVHIESIAASIRTLLNPDNPLAVRQAQYQEIAKAREAYRAAMAIYEPLPQRADEAQEWQAFQKILPRWVAANDQVLALHRELDQVGILNPKDFLGQIQRFRGDHYALEVQVTQLLLTGETFSGGEDATACNFGRWLATFQTANPVLRNTLNDMRAAHDRFHESAGTIRRSLEQGQREEAQSQFTESMHPAAVQVFAGFNTLISEAERASGLQTQITTLSMGQITALQEEGLGHLERVVEINNEIAEAAVASGHSMATFLKASSLIAMLMAITLALGLGLFITRRINQALKRIADSLAAGADQTSAAAAQVSAASQSLAEGASESAASLEETSASLEEMSSMTKRNAENASQCNDLMAEAKGVVAGMARATEEMSQAIARIKTSSDDTAKIVKTIDEIAFQTNILALNAAVEAARAGEAGAGFAVVADEVRSLAQRCAQAAKETAAKIEESVQNAGQGVQVTARVDAALQQTVSNASKTADLVAGIAQASQEQAQGIQQVNTAVSQMDKVTQGNAASAEESASAAEELNAQADALKEAVVELLRLVDGHQRGSSASNPTSAASHRRQTRHTQPSTHPSAQQADPTPLSARGSQPEPATFDLPARRNQPIPMEGGFRDF